MHNQYRWGRRLYSIGFIAAIIAIVAAQLIWVPASLPSGKVQWIEIINGLFYVLPLIPACLAAGAIVLTFGRGLPLWIKVTRYAIAASAVALIYFFLFTPGEWGMMLIAASIATVLAAVDFAASEWLERRKTPWRSGSALLVIIASLALLLIPTKENVIYPGMTLDLNQYAHIAGGGTGGLIDGVLVFERPAVLADKLYGVLFPQYSFHPIPENEPPLSESYAQVVAMKTDANRVAAAIALEKAGIGKGVVPEGAKIVAILKDSPAEGKLQGGDVITAINGKAIRIVQDMIQYMTDSIKPGQSAALTVKRGSEQIELSVPTVSSEQDASRAVFGVSVQTEVTLDTPRDIRFEQYKAHLGGPSHGAMLTLAFLDQLTPGGITGGLHVAGTGTIETDGGIGMVGGISQKAYAVSRTGADVFFVPAEGEQEARSGAPELNIVAVETIDDVLRWLKEHTDNSQVS
ncbi:MULTISPECIES: PDZ domain-containing protein [unclassified Paenibacillus]|uniref:PDZ domain-containing protein n=1 Tax=unclassified Paenibacillus TaxID=185978 RepID=UPI0036D36C40